MQSTEKSANMEKPDESKVAWLTLWNCAKKVLDMHDQGSLSKMQGDSLAIENLREALRNAKPKERNESIHVIASTCEAALMRENVPRVFDVKDGYTVTEITVTNTGSTIMSNLWLVECTYKKI